MPGSRKSSSWFTEEIPFFEVTEAPEPLVTFDAFLRFIFAAFWVLTFVLIVYYGFEATRKMVTVAFRDKSVGPRDQRWVGCNDILFLLPRT
jgi:hypothetical protein